jgi:hypothetical protein
MTQSRQLFVIQVFIALLPGYAMAQPTRGFESGYAVTWAGDTIRGLLRKDIATNMTKTPYDACWYKPQEGAEPVKYNASQLKSFRILDENMMVADSIQLNKEWFYIFLEVLVDGKVTLYKYLRFTDTYFFVQKDGGKLEQLTDARVIVKIDGYPTWRPSGEFKKVLDKMMLIECPSIKNDLTKAVLQEKRLTIIVEEYNSCMKSKQPTNK